MSSNLTNHVQELVMPHRLLVWRVKTIVRETGLGVELGESSCWRVT